MNQVKLSFNIFKFIHLINETSLKLFSNLLAYEINKLSSACLVRLIFIFQFSQIIYNLFFNELMNLTKMSIISIHKYKNIDILSFNILKFYLKVNYHFIFKFFTLFYLYKVFSKSICLKKIRQ